MAKWIIAALWTGIALSSSAQAAEAERTPFGTLADGSAVEAVTLSSKAGVTLRVMTLGATIQSLRVPDRNGEIDEITLGYDTAAEYLAKPQYFGATIGRFANRVAKGRFALNEKTYALATNDGPNHLHGGVRGFDKRLWSIVKVSSGDEAKAVMRYVSADGEEGYPGQLTATVTYSLNDGGEVTIAYEAITTKPTIVNLTNHTYYNLSGDKTPKSVLEHNLTLPASRFTPVDATLIPTGEITSVENTPFDFREATPIGARIHDADKQLNAGRGYDHNWVLDDANGQLRIAARLEDPSSGRVMEMLTTAPAIQFYSGNFLDGTVVGRGVRSYRQSDGLCLEPQIHPDAPNQPMFPSARLEPGQRYRNIIKLRFSKGGGSTTFARTRAKKIGNDGHCCITR